MLDIALVPEVGLEPTSLAAGDFESCRFGKKTKRYRFLTPQTKQKRRVKVGAAQRIANPLPSPCFHYIHRAADSPDISPTHRECAAGAFLGGVAV